MTAILSALLLVSVSGCDKLSFLSDYVPFLKAKAKPAAETTSSSTSPTGETAVAADVVAKVGNWTLTADEFNEKLKAIKEVIPDYDTSTVESKKLVLDELVRQQLLVQDAESRGIAQEKDIKTALDEFRRSLLMQEVATRVTSSIAVTDQQAEEYYNQNKDVFSEPGEWRLREIMVPTQEEAKEILSQLYQAGADFGSVAQARSKAASAAQGGDLGFIKEFKFPQMQTAVSILNTGDISSVFKGPDGYYIVKLEEKKGGNPQSFAVVKEEIKNGLTLMEQQQAILKYIDELKSKTTIVTNEELLK